MFIVLRSKPRTSCMLPLNYIPTPCLILKNAILKLLDFTILIFSLSRGSRYVLRYRTVLVGSLLGETIRIVCLPYSKLTLKISFLKNPSKWRSSPLSLVCSVCFKKLVQCEWCVASPHSMPGHLAGRKLAEYCKDVHAHLFLQVKLFFDLWKFKQNDIINTEYFIRKKFKTQYMV